MGPGLLAIFASLIVIWSQSPAPPLSFDLPTRGEAVTLSLYVFASLLTVWLAEKRRYGGAGRAESPILQWVTSILVACSAVMLTTFVLLPIDSYLVEEHLVLGYLLPTIVIAMHYGSTLAVITSFISGFAAAYFLFAPKFSFYIVDPLNAAELGFFLLLAITASKAVAGLTDDLRARNARPRPLVHPADSTR
jgi:glucose-6-phosphate-specific signal transduction histidine kinase